MYKIAVIPGDGTGPEVVNEGLKVLKALSEKTHFTYETVHYDFGGERYKKTGETLPDLALEEFKNAHAIYLGAIGHPRGVHVYAVAFCADVERDRAMAGAGLRDARRGDGQPFAESVLGVAAGVEPETVDLGPLIFAGHVHHCAGPRYPTPNFSHVKG